MDVVCLCVCATQPLGRLHSVSCCQRVPAVLASTWRPQTPSSSMTRTGIHTTTFRSRLRIIVTHCFDAVGSVTGGV